MGHVGSSLALTRSLARFFVLHIRPSPTTGLASSVSFCHAAVSQNRRLWLMCCVKGQSLGVGGWGEGFKWLAIDSAEDISAPLKRRSWRRLESASFVLEILSSGHEPAWRCSDSSSFLACPLPPLSPPPICISCSPYYRLFRWLRTIYRSGARERVCDHGAGSSFFPCFWWLRLCGHDVQRLLQVRIHARLLCVRTGSAFVFL